MHILYKLYPVTFGNDKKSYQNKSHNEITVQLCAKLHNFCYLVALFSQKLGRR